MSWQKETHEKRLDRFEQRLLGAQVDSRIETCRSRAMESRGSGLGEVDDPDDPILSLIEDLARRIDGLERMTANLSEELLLGNRRIHRMRSQCVLASVLILAFGLVACAWVKYTIQPPDTLSRTSDDHRDSARSGRGMHAGRVLKSGSLRKATPPRADDPGR